MAHQPGVRILLHGVYWLGEDGEPLGPGYVYIRSGVVEAVEPGEPPEERQYAELVAGGPGRLVIPGMVLALVVPETYPVRWLFRPSEARQLLAGRHPLARALAEMGSEEAYQAARMMFYEAALEGYSYVVAVTPHVEEAARAASEAGLEGLILYPRGCGALDAGSPPTEPGETLYGGRVRTGLLSCDGGEADLRLGQDGIVYGPDGLVLEPPPWRGSGMPAAVTAAAASPWPLLSGMAHPEPSVAYRGLAWEMPRRLFSREPLTGPASLAVIDPGEPPGWTPGPAPAAALGPARPRIDTLLSGGRLVVDGGEHLYLGQRAAEEAAEKLKGLAERLASAMRG